MKLEIGKRYVLRNGAITSPLQPYESSVTYPFTAELSGGKDTCLRSTTWDRNGKFDIAISASTYDIVREYEESAPATDVNEDLTSGLYLVRHDEDLGYDSYSSFVVCAPDEDTARHTDPLNGGVMDWSTKDGWYQQTYWCSSPDKVKVKYLGAASASVSAGIVCSSFHAG